MKLNSDYSLELIDDEYVLIHSSADEVDFSKVITFNEVGAFIFNKIKEGKTKEEILDDLVKEYDATKEEISKDLDEFLNDLIKNKIVYEQ